MSGGRLVVLDRLGREVKRYPLASGLATLGSDPRCDIRVMQPAVSKHHATVVVHAHQTVVRNVGEGETLVNGQAVSVAALQHGDLLTVGDRCLRWEYASPASRRPLVAEPALFVRSEGGAGGAGRAARGRRGGSGGATGPTRSPDLRLALELQHRASMPGNAGGKQVAIVQPQRRDTTEQNDQLPRPSPQAKRQRVSKTSSPEMARGNMTQAELWIESRKTSPRRRTNTTPQVPSRASLAAKKSTPLRLTVLRKAQSAHKPRVTKIQAPLTIDHTKRAALLLMTGHTPKAQAPSPRSANKSPAFVAKKRSPARRTPRTPRGGRTPKTPATATRTSRRGSGRHTVSILEISDSISQQSSIRESSASRRSRVTHSPLLPTPRKSALKDPSAKKSTRKTESIKFDLSNLDNHTVDRSDVLTLGETTKATDSASEDEITLHYSDTSSVRSPSPRKSIHSRSSRILERSLGTSVTGSPGQRSRSTLTAVTPDSPRRKSNRGTLILQKALDTTNNDSGYSRRTTKTLTDQSYDPTVASAFKTRTLSPRSPNQNLETYSIVDLVSIDSNESGRSTSVYNSAGSTNSSAIAFGTPQNSSSRKTRSTIDPDTLIGSSTPYVKPTRSASLKSQGSRKSSIKNTSNVSTRSSGSARRSKSLTTPENSNATQQHISVNSTKISRASKSRSRLNDSDLLLISSGDNSQLEDASPRSSRQVTRSTKSDQNSPAPTRKSSRRSGGDFTPSSNEKDQGISTPENRHSPEEVGTPVLSIQSLLNSSQSSFASNSSARKGRGSKNKRKTIGVIRSEPRRRTGVHSKSLNFTARRGLLRLSKDSSLASDKTDEGASKTGNGKMVTPKSGVQLVQEAVKNKHSTAKKPQSKRSIIDNLDESDIVKQLFNSPVKRKLSQSMTEFSRKQLFDDDEDIVVAKRPTRNTIAVTGRSPENSIVDHAEAITPEMFVSPISTPSHSPNLTGIKRLFRKNTPNNDLRNVKGVKGLLRTPRTRGSIKNDLTNISGVKQVFAKSPKNRLSDVRVKEVFAAGPKNDLRRVSGVKSLFQSQKERKSPRNDLSDVRGVKKLFQQNSPKNDLRRVSGVKRALQKGSPRNDLTDVRGVKKMFKGQKERNNLSDVSGIEELFNESSHSVRDSERLFDQLIGKPPIKAVYSKSFVKKPVHKPMTRNRSLRMSVDVITNNVEEWIEQELQRRLHKDNASKTISTSVSRELQKLATDTVEGSEPIRSSRVRNSSIKEQNTSKKSASELYSAHTLPIKKRSLVEASLEKARSSARKSSLPIKKRAVVHSTPVKGRGRLTMNASELGRVSPIAIADTSLRSESTIAVAVPKSTRGKRSTKVATEIEAPDTVTKSPPKASPKTKVAKAVTKSPPKASPNTKALKAVTTSSPKTKAAPSPQARATRRNNKTDNSLTNTKKRRSSLVISKKSPVMSPKPAPRTRRGKVEQKIESPQLKKQTSKVEEVEKSPKKTRATRKLEVKPATPKRTTRAKVQKATVVVGKPSPQLKPKSQAKVDKTKTKAVESAKDTEAKMETQPSSPRKSRKTAASEKNTQDIETKSKRRKVESPKKSPQPARTRRNAEIEPKGRRNKAENETKQLEPEKKERKGRKTQVVEVEDKIEPKRRRNKADNETTKPEPEKKERKGRKTQAVEVEDQIEPKGRRNKADNETTKLEPEKKERKGRKTQVVEIEKPVPKRARKIQDEDKQIDTDSLKPTRSRGKKLEPQASVQSEPTTRSRRGKPTDNTVIPEIKTRKRKTTSENVIPSKISKTNPKDFETTARKGRKTTIETTEIEKGNVRQKRSVVKDNKVEISERQKQDGTVENVRTVRSRKVVVTATETTAVPKEPKATRNAKAAPKQTETKTNTRKKKTEASPVKQPTPAKASPARPRAARNKGQEVATKTTVRSRRR